jgi:YgiT-type zinc finger domain-containing protein
MKCVICRHGETREGTTTVTFERDGMTLVVKDVPAQICTNCGEDYVDEQVAREILGIAERMAKSGALVDVRRYVPGSAVPC